MAGVAQGGAAADADAIDAAVSTTGVVRQRKR